MTLKHGDSGEAYMMLKTSQTKQKEAELQTIWHYCLRRPVDILDRDLADWLGV